MREYDAQVIGGGPAGAAAAIRLAQSGRRVHLFEKGRYPRSKVCGGFISAESLADLTQLGVLSALQRSGAHTVNRVVVASPSADPVTAPLPAPGLSISRRTLDSLLIDQARSCGVQVTEETDGFSNPDEAPWSVIACGRGTANGYRESNGHSTYYYGVQSYFDEVRGISDQVELDFVPGVYVGLVRQQGQVNICLLADRRCFSALGPDLDVLLKFFMSQNRTLASHLSTARRTTSWQAVGPVRIGLRQLTAPSRFFAGDAACVVDPFAGQGIAMGLRASALIVQALSQSAKPPEQAYESAWHQTFDSALRMDTFLRYTMGHRLLQELVVRGLKVFPQSLTQLAKRTRPPLAAVA